MKKIISLLLALVLLLTALTAFTSCSGVSKDATVQMRHINAMFETLVPTESVTTTTQKIGSLTLTSVATLTVGTLDGSKGATYINEYEQLAPLDGSTNASLVQPKVQKLWYVEGKGLCKNGNGKWIADGEDFRPKAGDVKISLTANMLDTAEYDAASETFVATMDKDNANKLLSKFLPEEQEISSGLTMTVVTAGGRVTVLKLEYTEPSHDIFIGEEGEEKTEKNVVTIPEALVTVEIHYSYDAKVITLN